jgi:hypothetical protein
VRGQEAC